MITLLDNKKECVLIRAIFVGVIQFSIGALFFILKPYKKAWMSKVDGIIFTLLGCYFLMKSFNNIELKIFVVVSLVVFVILTLIYKISKAH